MFKCQLNFQKVHNSPRKTEKKKQGKILFGLVHLYIEPVTETDQSVYLIWGRSSSLLLDDVS